jgi:hypothetical protein
VIDVIVTRTVQGLQCATVHASQRYSRLYIGYTKQQAERDFRRYVKAAAAAERAS